MATDEMIAPDLLAMVRCPRCRGTLAVTSDELRCDACRLLFDVVDGVPNFLLEDARPMDRSTR